MIGNLRKFFGSIIIKVFLVIIVLSFILWGVGDIVKNIGTGYAAKVAGKSIPTELLLAQVEKEKRRIEMQSGEPFQDAMKNQLMQFVLDRMINNELIDKFITKEHLNVSDAKALESIQQENIFKDKEGKFDSAKLKEFVLANKINERKFVDEIQKEISRKMVLDVISSRIPSDDIVKLIKQFLNFEYKISIYKMDVANQTEKFDPSDQEQQKFYENNKSLFMSPESRDVQYFQIALDDIKKTIKVTEDELQEEYKLRDYREAKASFDSMKSKLEAEIVAKKLDNVLQKLLDEIEDNIASGMNIDEISKKYNKQIVILNNITQSSENLGIPGVLRDKIMSDSNIEEAKVVLNHGDAIYVYKVKYITEPAPIAFDKVKDVINRHLKNAYYVKLLQQLPDSSEKLVLDIKEINFKILDIDSKIPATIPASLIGDTLSRNIGEFSGIHKGMEGIFYLAKLTDIQEVPAQLENEAALERSIKNNIQNEIIWAFFNYMRENQGVRVNKAVFNNRPSEE